MSCLKPNFSSEKQINIVVNKDDNVDSLVKKFVTSEWSFALSKDESLDQTTWEDSIEDYLNSIEKYLKSQNIEQNVINEVKDNIKTTLLTNNTEVEEDSDNDPEIPDAELDTSKQKTEIKLNTQLRNIFGDDRILTNNFKKQFKSEIFRRTIIQIGNSVDSSKIVYDIDSLNKAIMNYQSQLHNILYTYLKNHNLLPEGKRVANLYDDNGDINPNYSKNINAFQKFISSQDNLQKLIATETYSGNKELLNAVHAFLALEYFDKLMLESVGKYLYINTKQTQPILEVDGRTRYKYSINRKNVNLASGWQNEIRDGIDEIGSFSQLIIEQIPLIDTDYTLDKVSTITAFLKLKYAISQLGDTSSLPNRIKIRSAYKNLNKNTIGSWKEILSVLNSAKSDGNLKRELIKVSFDNGREKVGLTDNDFNIFDSVYEYFFNGTNGVYHIERANEFSGGRSNYGITESLFATINSTTQANYLEMRLNNGNSILRYKEKWNSRDRMFQLRKAINDNVFRKSDIHFLDDFNIEKGTGAVQFGDFRIDISRRSALGIFSFITDYDKLSIVKDGKNINITDYFKRELEEIYSEEGRKNILTDEKYSEFRNFLSNIDGKLGTKFLSDSGLQQLRIYNQIWKKGNSLHYLFITAARVAGAYYVNNQFKAEKEKNSELTSFDITKYLKESNPTPYTGMKFISSKDSNIIYKYGGGMYISGVPINSEVLDYVSDAEAIFQGDNTKSVTRNLENNNIPNVSVNFTDIIQEFYDQGITGDEEYVEKPTDKLLFSGKGAYSIVDTVIDTDVETYNGNKSVDQFTTSELLYHSLVNKFIHGIQDTGMFISQPVTYSDKKKFLNFVVNWKSIEQYSKFKNVFQITEQTHIDLIQDTQGKYYKTLFNKIANDYRTIFGINNSDDYQVFLIANKKMKELSNKYGKSAKNEFIKLANSKNIKIYEDLHYRNLSKVLISPNETLYHYANYIFQPENLSNFLNEQKISYVNQLLDNYVVIPYDQSVRNALSQAVENTNINASDWVQDDLLILAKVNGKNIVAGDQIPAGSKIELNPVLNTYFYLHNVIDNNVKLGITGHELHHKIKSIGSVLKNTELKAKTYLDIEQSIQDEYNSISKAKNQEEIDNINNKRKTLNKAYYTLISLAQNAQFKRTVPIPGTIRPFSQGTLKGIASTYDCAVVEDLKALTHDFLGNNGFEDDSSNVDAHDGSSWIDPFTSILENYSLEDSEGGEVKKPLWDIDEPQYGVRRLVKYASNTITNRIMLQSSTSTINMYKLFKKMTNCRKFDDIDLIDDWFITGGYKPNSFATNIINKENPLFYGHNGQYYQIINFGKDIREDGEKVYYTIEDDVDENGNTLGNDSYKVYHYFDDNSNHIKVREGESVPENVHTINSLFELHASMGGIESMSIRDGRLIESEASNRAVAHFMIYVSKPTEKYNELKKGNTHYQRGADITQEYFNQPLKTRLINCIINQSAIKNGASNVNSVNTLTDDTELMYDTYSTLKYGIQQDSDHTADEGKVTEMSQVISALDANGLYHDEVLEIYKALGQQAIKAAQIEEEAIHSNYDKLYEVVGKTLVNNIQRDERGLTRALLYQIRKNFGLSSNHNLDKIKIPFSDPSIYGKIMQTMGSILNKKSIKRKYPGMGQVMVPAFGIYQIWEINGNKYQYKDLLKRAIEHNNELGDEKIPDIGDPIDFNNKIVSQYLDLVSPNETVYNTEGINSLWKIDPTNVLNITYINSLGNTEVAENIKLNSLPDYYDFKENQQEFLKSKGFDVVSIVNIEKNNKVPRDLAPTRVHFTYEYNGIEYKTNLFDTWIYKDMYRAMKSKKQDPLNVEYYDQVINSYKKQIPGFLAQLEKGNYAFKIPTGQVVKATVTQMSNQAAENIMSNVYKSRMGIKDGDEIPDIDSPEYFKSSIKPLNSEIFDYDIQLITKNNNGNIYISLSQFTDDNENYQSRYIPWKTTNITKVKVNKKTDSSKVQNRVYYVDNNNIRQFEIGRDLDVSDEIYYDQDTGSYKSITTNEIITGRKLFRETDNKGNTKILEYVEFLLKSEIKPKRGNSFVKYNIDQVKLNKVLLRNINPKSGKETQEKFSNALTNIIESLYKSDSFLMLTPARRIKKENYRNITTILHNFSERNKNTDLGIYLRDVLENVFTHSAGTINGTGYINLDSGNTVKLNQEVEALNIDRKGVYGSKLISYLRSQIKSNPLIAQNFARINKQFNQSQISYYDDIYLDKMANKQFASFKKSVFFTSSRIPAQTLQSFMKMECVGFNGVDTNYCAVSHFQAFLQGSDYDIDKSYMMGLNFDNNGIYMGWSDIFSYNSLEEIEASEELPMPSGKRYQYNNIFRADDIDISQDVLQISSEQNSVNKIKLVASLLKKLNKASNERNISVYIDKDIVPESVGLDFVNNVLNKHEQTEFGSNVDSILKNYVSSNIQKLIQKLGNLADAYSPVEMKSLRDMLKYTPKQELATSLSLFNPAMVPIMQNTNMTGKQGTGVAANGQKGLFMWRFGTLDVLRNNPKDTEFVLFNTTISGVQGRFDYEQKRKEYQKSLERGEIKEAPNKLNPITLQSLPDLGIYTNGFSVLSPKLKSDNIGSQYISAATDNAKELILAAINSGTKLMKCHLYLLSLGFDVEDIISFMTSPAVSFIDSISDDNIFNGTKIKVKDAISFAQRYISSLIEYNQADNLDKKQEIQQRLNDYSLQGIRKIVVDSFKTKLNRVQDLQQFLEDLYSLEHILLGANEFSTFGTILGINQGIPQTKEDLVAWKNKFVTAISIACSNQGLINKNKIPQYCDAVKQYFTKIHPEIFTTDGNNFNLPIAYSLLGIEKGGKSEIQKLLAAQFVEHYQDIIDFNPDLWLSNQEYRNKTSEFYNLFKQSINIFYLIDYIPHFKSMFRIANILNNIDKEISLKSQVSNHFNTLLKQKYPYAPNDYINKLLPAIDEILIGHYIKSQGISIKLKDEWKTLDSNYKENTGSKKLDLLTDNDISSFKYVFENFMIPELQNGTLLDNSEENELIKNNEFIKNLMITSENGKPLYKEDINLLLTDSNDESRKKYQTLLQGIKALKSFSYNGIPLVDLFMLYNIIVNKNRYGAERMTEIFEDFILDYDDLNSSFLTRYLINLGEEDYTKQLLNKITSSVTLTDLLQKIAPTLSRIDNSKQDPFIKVLDPNKGYVYYEKTSAKYSTTPVDLLIPIPGELYNQTIERQVRFQEYEFGLVYSQYVSEIINNLMSDNFEYVLDQLMQNMTVQQITKCE